MPLQADCICKCICVNASSGSQTTQAWPPKLLAPGMRMQCAEDVQRRAEWNMPGPAPQTQVRGTRDQQAPAQEASAHALQGCLAGQGRRLDGTLAHEPPYPM